MNQIVGWAMVLFYCGALWTSFVFAEDIILPHGDPRVQQPVSEEQDRWEEIRKNRLKQQGQGENYRVEGELQGGSKGPKVEKDQGHDRQDTGIEDPTVNPGQAQGLKTIRGRVVKTEEHSVIIERVNGEEIIVTIDPETSLNKNLYPGDRITGTVTNQGRAVEIVKEGRPEP